MRTIITPLLVALSLAVHAQTTILGTVSDKGGPIPGANIMLVGTYDGTTSDERGTFRFTTTETGTRTVSVSYMGYKRFAASVNLAGKVISLEVILEEEINELNAVTISAGAFTASDEARRTVLRAVDVATTAGATADIAGALNTLPGTQKVGETGRLFVRGGDGREARTFIDGMLVLDAYSPAAPNTPSRGRFLPFMFKGISFSTGGYSAEYGQALSSALVLDSRDEASTTRTDIGLLSVGGDVTHAQAWEGGSAAAKLQYTNLRPYVGLVRQEIDWDLAPVSVEGVGAFRQRIGKYGIVKAYANFNHSDLSLRQHDIGDTSRSWLYRLTNDYRYLNAFAKTAVNENWMVRGGISYTDIANDTRMETDRHTRAERGLHVKAVLDGSISDRIGLRAGTEVIARDVAFQSHQDGLGQHGGFDEVIPSAFAEADLFASNRFVTRAGVRGEYNSLNGQLSLDPRISLALKTGEYAQLSLAYGTFRQSVQDEFLLADRNLSPEMATHAILNFQRTKNKRTFRAETYYKRYDDLVRATDMTFPDNSGYGYAAGVDLFWRDNNSVKNLDYWLSYSFLDTERDYLHFPHASVPSFASKHNFSAVAKYFVVKLKSQLGATFSYTSGRPYDNPNGATFNEGTTPAYIDLSFNWSFLPKPWIIVYASCNNLIGRDNIFGYEFSAAPDEFGHYASRAIRQPAPRFLFLGVFITISKDKSVNQLPSL